VFKDAYAGLADRHADLAWLRNSTPPNRWLTSSLSWEMEAIELVRDDIFTDRADAFPDLIENHEADPRLQTALSDCDPRTWAGFQADARARLDRIMEVTR
jgi:hypothetical protein